MAGRVAAQGILRTAGAAGPEHPSFRLYSQPCWAIRSAYSSAQVGPLAVPVEALQLALVGPATQAESPQLSILPQATSLYRDPVARVAKVGSTALWCKR